MDYTAISAVRLDLFIEGKEVMYSEQHKFDF